MAVDVIMPHMGESVVEGTITLWLKQAGDAVEEDEPLVEIETDKINVEVPAPASGVLLKILAGEGATVAVDDTIAVIGDAGEALPETPPAKAAAPPKPAGPLPLTEAPPAEELAPMPQRKVEPPELPEAAPAPPHAPSAPPVEAGKLGVLASPAVRRFGREVGVDLGEVKGTGRMGRITRQDVQDYVDDVAKAQAEADAARAATEAEKAPAKTPPRRAPDVDEELVPLTRMRRAIAEHMVRSKTEAPHVTTVAEVDMSEVAALRKEWKASFAEQGVKLTYMAFILNAVGRALHDCPELNASWTDEGVLIKYRINLGLAVAIEEGLVVPVVRDADRLDLLELARAIQTVAQKTRAGKVAPKDVRDGTFTITNPGVLGAVISTPIIHQPQAAILATGRIADAPAVVNGGLAIRKQMFLSLSYDHRIVDGATAVRFLQRVREILEQADFEKP